MLWVHEFHVLDQSHANAKYFKIISVSRGIPLNKVRSGIEVYDLSKYFLCVEAIEAAEAVEAMNNCSTSNTGINNKININININIQLN